MEEASPTPLGQLLLAALDDGRERDVAGLLRRVDEGLLLQAAWHHRAAVGLHLLLSRLDAGSRPARAQLRRAHQEQQLRSLRALADLHDVGQLFAEHDVRWVTYKGLALAETAYREPGLRMFTDLDILVHPADLGTAVRLLRRNGAEHLGASWAQLQRSGIAQVSLQLRQGSVLDLHWHPFSLPWARRAFPVDVAALLASARARRVAGVDVRLLSPEDTVVHLAVHGCLSGAYRLLWLKDLDQAYRSGDLRPELMPSRASAWNAELPLFVMLGRTRLSFDTPVAQPVDAPAGGRGWARLLAQSDRMRPVHEQLAEQHHSGQLLWCSTREDSRHSAAAALRSLLPGQAAQVATAEQPEELGRGAFDEAEFNHVLATLQ